MSPVTLTLRPYQELVDALAEGVVTQTTLLLVKMQVWKNPDVVSLNHQLNSQRVPTIVTIHVTGHPIRDALGRLSLKTHNNQYPCRPKDILGWVAIEIEDHESK